MEDVRSMNEDGPNDSPYEMLVKHNQSETKRDSHVATDHGQMMMQASFHW
jgi:hypothetical protein